LDVPGARRPRRNRRVAGVDVGELTDDGRLRRITGFFGDLAARDDD
jgi:hypothetical protein